MKKIVLTLTIMVFAMQGFAQDLMFDNFLKQHEVIGPKLDKIVCDMEELTRQILSTEDLEKQQLLAEEVRVMGDALRDDIRKLRSKNATSCDNYLMGYAVASAVGNPGLTPIYAGLYSTNELPKSNYFTLVDEMVHLAWRIKIAHSPEKVEKKTHDLLATISDYNTYHAQ